MRTRSVVPNEPGAIRAWAADFKAKHGFAPIAGGETPGAAVATPPAPAPASPAPTPAPAPAAPAQTPAPVPTPAPGQPATPAPGAAPQPGAPEGQQAPQADATPEWAQKLLDGMDQLAPPAQVDPLAVELGLVPPPPQPLPGQPGYDPSQAGPAAGRVPQGAPQQQPPAALPGQQVPPVPGQPQPGVDPETALVEQYIDQRAEEVATRMLQERVAPLFQQQEVTRRRTESQALLDDYPELKDPAKGQALVAQARAWAQETLGDPRFAGEPGYLEVVHLAMKGLEAQGQAPGQTPAPGSGEVPIEGGSGAQPPAATTESTELAQRIVDAKPGGGLSNLWV